MYEQVSQFGPFFRSRRNSMKIGIWPLCVKISMYPANLIRIEKGIQEPRLDIALKMISGLSIQMGNFFAGLCHFADVNYQPREKESETHNLYDCHIDCSSLGLLFGGLLQYSRIISCQSQKQLAEAASIHLRNLTNIENGTQIPRVMTAIRLVCGTNCDVEKFFNELEKRYICV